jgi:Ca-activated chloride channel family protein
VSFDNPRALLALFLLIPAVLFAFIHYRKRRAVLGFLSRGVHARDTGGGASPGSLVSGLRFRYLISAAAFHLFLACAIIALAQPRGGSRLVNETRRGVDVVFAIDLSRSMDVRDIASGGPSRLGRAAALAAELAGNPWFSSRRPGGGDGAPAAAGAPGVRFGAAIGKGRGVLALPLTEDTEAILSFLSGLSGAAVTGRGTNLESLVDAASAAFQDAFPSRRRIILLSDGESLSGSLSDALDRALAAEAGLIAVGLGSEEGGAVPLGGGPAGQSDSLLGEDGVPVVSMLRSDTLKDAAERTGGIYVDGNRSNAAAVLADYLASLAVPAGPGDLKGTTAPGFRREKEPLGYIFVIAALLFMGVSKMAEKGRRKHG